MAELTVQNVLLAGVVKAALVAATSTGDTFDNDGLTWVEINNGSGSSITVTVTGQVNLQFLTSADKTVTVLAAGTQLIGPFPERFYNTDGSNEVSLTYSDVTTVTVAAYSAKDVNA